MTLTKSCDILFNDPTAQNELTIHHSPFTIHHSPFTIHHSRFTNSLSLALKNLIVKSRTIVLIIAAIIVADQALKFWVKTSMLYGEQITLIPNWFRLFFIENEGMAWGWKFGGEWGKMTLTIFRLLAVIFGVFYIRNIVRKKYHKGFIICVGLIFAGALGNLIDSMFYGLIFEESTYDHVARIFPPHGYAGF